MSAQHAPPIGLHDDTEEDLLGADWHQDAILNLAIGLRDIARRAGFPWHVGDQLTLVAPKWDGTIWRPSPDIMVHPRGGPARRKEMVGGVDGLPALIIEGASQSTWRYDVNLDRDNGKAGAYLALGVPAYLVFDPTGEYLSTPCYGWQRTGGPGGTVRDWLPTPAGLYEYHALGVSFRPEGDLLRVFDAAGRPVLFLDHEESTEEYCDTVGYVVASGLWHFLRYMLLDELHAAHNLFDEGEALRADPDLADDVAAPRPWDA